MRSCHGLVKSLPRGPVKAYVVSRAVARTVDIIHFSISCTGTETQTGAADILSAPMAQPQHVPTIGMRVARAFLHVADSASRSRPRKFFVFMVRFGDHNTF